MGTYIIVLVVGVLFGFIACGLLTQSKLSDLENDNMNLRIGVNRKDDIISFYQKSDNKNKNISSNK